MPIPATARLVDFSSAAFAVHPHASHAPHERPVVPLRNPDEAYAAGRDAGIAAGRAEAEAEAAAVIVRMQSEAEQGFDERLADARAQWTAEEGERLAAQLRDGLAALDASIGADVAAILTPVVDAALRERCVAALHTALAPVIAGASAPILRVSGPADLVATLQARLGSVADCVVADVSASPELRVMMDRTLIETRLGVWSDALAGESA